MLPQLQTVELFDLAVITNKKVEFEAVLVDFLRNSRKDDKRESGNLKLLMTPNPEQVVLAEQDSKFKKSLQKADWLIPDGVGLVKASRYLYRLKLRTNYCQERIAGADIVKAIMTAAQKAAWPVLVVGGFYDEFVVEGERADSFCVNHANKSGKNAVVEKELIDQEKKQQEKCVNQEKESGMKKIKLTDGNELWWTVGYDLIKEPTKEEDEKIKALIEEIKPKIVFVAFGAPDQEEWMVKYRAFLAEKGVNLVMAVGGSFDFLTGKVGRAPMMVQNAGLEWAFRLMKQPWRWRRQLALVKFMNLLNDKASEELTAQKRKGK